MLIGEEKDDSGFLIIIGIFALSAILTQNNSKLYVMVTDVRFITASVLVLLMVCVWFGAKLWSRFKTRKTKKQSWAKVIGQSKGAVYCGLTDKAEHVFLKESQRSMHTQVIGTTNAGKTESVILPWAIQDLTQGRGLIIIDGKADRGILDKIYAYASKAGRSKDFRLFSLSNIAESSQYNPLIGGTPEEIAERVFNSFEIEHSYYRAIQFEVLSQMLRIFEELKLIPTFERLHDAISSPAKLEIAAKSLKANLAAWFSTFLALPSRDRLERTSGLTSALGQFAFGRHGNLFNTETPKISIEEALNKNQILYFQLPVLLSPFLGKAVGKLVLQDLQSVIANRHRTDSKGASFFSVFLDDFTEYLYPGFVSILNKSRSAKIGIVFAHQALGDIEGLGKPIANAILTNSNLKIFMRGTDPESAEYFSRVIGTRTTTKATERTKRSLLGQRHTGDASAREVEEFKIHPNKFKSALGVGEAYVVIPYEQGSRTEFIKFRMLADLPAQDLPIQTPLIARPLAEIVPQKVVEEKKPDSTTENYYK